MNPQTERRHPASVLFCPVPTPYVSSPDAGAPLVEQEAEPPVSDPAPVWDPAKYCSWCDMDHNKNPKLHPTYFLRDTLGGQGDFSEKSGSG